MARTVSAGVTEKARLHGVEATGPGEYIVTSATSGKGYRVLTADAGATATCSCAWGQANPAAATETGCSHMQAVWQYELKGADFLRRAREAAAVYNSLIDQGVPSAVAAQVADAVMADNSPAGGPGEEGNEGHGGVESTG